ncbi:hypothetical protein Dsin_026494 [Dipteronia sinensis]|uniref:3-hydroxyisobutyryl-CoA hydrolase n=1 Tax=Dipteronia sinensis TaxID=43782 RepID=A0AAE0DZC0_9ROSI|nr:hypothetical protein Dsin_026494 [Dipteronia sinensis]
MSHHSSDQSRTLFPSLFCTCEEVFVGVFRGARLTKLYRSWEDNPDIGFVTMMMVNLCYDCHLLDAFFLQAFVSVLMMSVVKFVHKNHFELLKGSGMAFCAGGDIVAVYNMMNQDASKAGPERTQQATEKSLVYLLGTYLKPHVAILNGITMGGGAGVSIPSTFRITTGGTECNKDMKPVEMKHL